jgi:hypothetical protein
LKIILVLSFLFTAGRNFMRGALLGLLATFAGMVICTAPETLFQMLKMPLPGILATQPGLLVSEGRSIV